MARYFLDTEFNGFGGELISLALAPQDGDKTCLYLATKCTKPVAWVKDNVMPIIEADNAPIYIPKRDFGRAIAVYLADDTFPIIVADWPDDIRYFCESLITSPGYMVAIQRLAFELVRVDAYPTTLPGAVQHNALWDALALRHLFTQEKPNDLH